MQLAIDTHSRRVELPKFTSAFVIHPWHRRAASFWWRDWRNRKGRTVTSLLTNTSIKRASRFGPRLFLIPLRWLSIKRTQSADPKGSRLRKSRIYPQTSPHKNCFEVIHVWRTVWWKPKHFSRFVETRYCNSNWSVVIAWFREVRVEKIWELIPQ